jgi:hypothetical protein
MFIDTYGGDEKSYCPNTMTIPIHLAEILKFFLHLPAGIRFDSFHDLRNSVFGGNNNVNVHMVFVSTRLEDINVWEKFVYLLDQVLEIHFHAVLKDFSSVPCYPYNVILGFVDGMCLLAELHIPILSRGKMIRDPALIPALTGGDFPLR